MKSVFFFIFLSTIAVFGQPVLTESNQPHDLGEQFQRVYNIDWDGTPPTFGADQVWDYSYLTPYYLNPNDSVFIVDPALTSVADSFMIATH